MKRVYEDIIKKDVMQEHAMLKLSGSWGSSGS
jgi:hypothetical protein